MAIIMTTSDVAPSPFKTLSSQVVLRTPYFCIEQDDVHLGDATGMYWVMRRSPFAACIVSNENGEILCVRNWRYPIQQWRWELPQGSADSSDMMEVARIETLEEAGVVVMDLHLVGEVHEAYGYSNATCSIFSARSTSVGAAAPEPLEAINGSCWLSLEGFWAEVAKGEISDAVSLAAVAMWQRGEGK